MSGFMNIIHTVGVDPRAWIVLALFAARAIWSIVSLSRVSARAACGSPLQPSDPASARRPTRFRRRSTTRS